jgi:DNA-binding transcriptional LysR family regulator
MFDLAQLRCFVAVADELHFGRAAARLHMTQPPLSRQIQLLEHAVGTRLLERTSRSVRLTAAGSAFYDDAAAIIGMAERAADTARRTGSGQSGRVVVGYTAVAGYVLIPSLLAAAAKAFPDIDIVLQEMVSTAQLASLEEGSIDLGFVRPLHAVGGVRHHRISREPLMLAVPAKHPLAARPRIRMQDLAGEPLVMYSRTEGKYFHDKIVSLFGSTATPPRYVHHIAQTHTILALVRAGIGCAIVPASGQHLRLEDVVFRPLWRADAIADIDLCWREDSRNPAAATLRRFVVERWKPPAAQRTR